jgi:transcriptional regulator with XRE-family HTH domain
MIAHQSGSLIKELRGRRGFTQAELASSAQVSRTVVSRLEQGKAGAVQSDVLDRIFRAVGVDPALVVEPTPSEERRIARLQQQRKLAENRCRHLRLALRLSAGDAAAVALVGRARGMVSLWKRNRTCSPQYIERWSRLLALPPRRLAQEMAALGDWEDALFQNSPWSWAWS